MREQPLIYALTDQTLLGIPKVTLKRTDKNKQSG